jgi:hypothetical protein
MGHTESHLCFTSEPLAGAGDSVFVADVPSDEIEQYEYKNEFRDATTRFFAVPAARVRELPLVKETFEGLTGRSWNRWIVPVLDRRAVRGDPSLRGKWSLVWVSREGIASARVYRKVEGTFLSIEVMATEEFDPEKDNIVVEHHEEFSADTPSGMKETWRLEHLSGLIPHWAVFPTAWQAWVWNRKVSASANQYLLTLFPKLKGLILASSGKETKHNKARSWRLVADEIGVELSRRLRDDIHLGMLAGHSWTAVNAMPMRIALRVSQNLPDHPWIPPVPKPEYQNPEESGRYLLANLYGAYPKQGPGFDHAPQDRVYSKLEGELTRP